MSANVDLLRKGYEDFARGDVAAASESWPEDFVMEGPNAEGLPASGVHEGKAAVLQALAANATAVDEQTLVPNEFIEQGDTVVVLLHAEVRKGDQSVKSPAVHIYRFSDGEPRRVLLLFDTLQAARLLDIA